MSGSAGGNPPGAPQPGSPHPITRSPHMSGRKTFAGVSPSLHGKSSIERDVERLVAYVFEEDLRKHWASNTHPHHSLQGLVGEGGYGSVPDLLRQLLEDAVTRPPDPALVLPWSREGRLGPDRVQFDWKSEVGRFCCSHDRLGLSSQENFSTIRANTCVYKGKWQYELMLGTKGVMQVGWATVDCKFSEEKGVGDSPDSYAYDGNRQRKWNLATYKYGAMWQCGDIISCTLDLTAGVVEFFRNGRSLGPAFTNVKTGPGVAYFPAVSLAFGENLIVNFGATPLRYPQPGFCPLEPPPTEALNTAHRCVSWLTSLAKLHPPWMLKSEEMRVQQEGIGGSAHRASVLVVVQHVATHLGPLLTTPYVVEACLVPAIATLAELTPERCPSLPQSSSSTAGLNLNQAHILFDFLMASLENHELLKCLENLIMCLLTGHKQVAENIFFTGQKYNLRLLYVLLSHTRLRKFCLNHILFDKVRFPSFVNIKTVDDEGLVTVVPSVWWSAKDGSFCSGDKTQYEKSCSVIHAAVQEVEEIQVAILRQLLVVTDGPRYQDSSRALFLAKFRTFLKEHNPGSGLHSTGYTPLPVILCLFHRLLTIFSELWKTEGQSGEVTIPPQLFYNGSLNYFDTQRLGGLESHLVKTLKEELQKALPRAHTPESKVMRDIDNATAGASAMTDVDMCPSEPSTSGALLGPGLMTGEGGLGGEVRHVTVTPGPGEDKAGPLPSSPSTPDSLLQLLDGIVLLYHIAHKQLGKIAAQRDSMQENITHVQEIDKKMAYCQQKGSNPALLAELSGSRQVFISKLEEQARQQAWVLAAVHSNQKYEQLAFLMRVILSTLKAASKEGELFAFVPDFYVNSLTEMCTALRHYFTIPQECADSSQQLFSDVGEFLALHFCDRRIVYADSKDALIQALAGFVCHQSTLTALEKMPDESRRQMVRNLLQPYENRAWAQNNWILVRFWKGCGFGFRYTKSPHLTNKFGPKPPNYDTSNFTQATAPCPSQVFQRHVVEVLQSSADISTPFLNSLLNQLNWAFSEFIGMLQEIQNASNRPERVFIDSRQLRICATCFDLALALLRVLEMIVNIAPELFTDFSKKNAQSLLIRLCQLLCQVLNRVSGWSGCFSHVVGLEIPGLETIHHYPILTAVSGILVTLINNDFQCANTKAQVATGTLLNEPSFLISSIQQLLGESPTSSSSCSSSSSSPAPSNTAPIPMQEGGTDQAYTSQPAQGRPGVPSAGTPSQANKFSFLNYPNDITKSEVAQVRQVIEQLESCLEVGKEVSPGADDDSLCTICYAYPASVVFQPCTHSSCRACVTQHLMNRSECFFCKSTIHTVLEQGTGAVVYQAPTTKTDQKPN